MERSEGKADRLSDEIYDAGASPTRWSSTLSSIASAVGAAGGAMFGFSKSQGLILEYSGALDAGSAEVFKTRHLNNVWVKGMAERPDNNLVLTDEIIRLKDLKRSARMKCLLHRERIQSQDQFALTPHVQDAADSA